MWLDRLATARRIDQPIEVKSDIANAFDGITYEKGGAVLTMFEHSMGAEKFRQAARLYLNKHAFANGTSKDFLDALAAMGGPGVATAFRTFLQQPGVPEVEMTLECAGGAAKLALHQTRFVPLGSTAATAQQWQIPVCAAYDDAGRRATACTTLDAPSGELKLAAKSCPAWFLGNADGAGYYYTHYEGPALMALIAHRDQLALAEQIGLFSELDSIAIAGRLPLSQGLKFAPQLKDAPERQIVDAALSFARVRVGFLPANLRPKYAAYLRENFGARARKLGWLPKAGESEDDRLLRPGLVSLIAGEGEDPELIASARELANRWLETRQALPADMLRDIFHIAARNGDAALYEKFLAAAKGEKDEFFEQALIGALGAFRQPELVQRDFQLLLSGGFDFRLSFRLLFAGQSVPELERLPLEWLKVNYDALVAKLPSAAGSDYAGFLPEVAARGCSEADAREAEAFFAPRMAKVNGGARNLAQTVEGIRLCEARKAVQQPDLIRFFEGL
jgi:alanyl aminopeptidase